MLEVPTLGGRLKCVRVGVILWCDAMGMVWDLESGSDDFKASLYDFKAV